MQMNNLEFLQNTITDKMELDEIIDTFEEMCQTSIEDDMILFETGTYDFTGEPLFYFSLVRQLPNEEEEYIQIHVDVLYKPNQENKKLSESIWNEDLEENIFDYIRKSKDYNYAKDDQILKIDIYMDET